jgi:hypothetical protein
MKNKQNSFDDLPDDTIETILDLVKEDNRMELNKSWVKWNLGQEMSFVFGWSNRSK